MLVLHVEKKSGPVDTAIISTREPHKNRLWKDGQKPSQRKLPKEDETNLVPRLKSSKPSEGSHVDREEDGERLLEKKTEEVSAYPCEDQSLKDAAENGKETTHLFVPEELFKIGKEYVHNASTAPTPEMSRSRKGSRGKKKEDLVQEINCLFRLLLTNKCLAKSHLNWVLEYTMGGLQLIILSSKLFGGNQTPYCIHFLRTSQLTKVAKFLQ